MFFIHNQFFKLLCFQIHLCSSRLSSHHVHQFLLFILLLANWQRPHLSGEWYLRTSYYKQGYCINRMITQSEYILWTRITAPTYTASSKFLSSMSVHSFLTRRLDWNMTYRVFSEWQRDIAHSTNTYQSTSQPTRSLTPVLVLSPYLIIIRHEEVCYWAITALHLTDRYNTGSTASQPDMEHILYEVMLKIIVFWRV